MRHYLNTDLKGKKDIFGLQRYSVYVMFSVNRQTFKIKSRVLNRMFSVEEFNNLLSGSRIFIQKDEEIINSCIKACTKNDFLDIDEFKDLYSRNCTSISQWLEEQIINQRQNLMDDFFYGSGVPTNEKESDPFSAIERRCNVDRRNASAYLNRFTHNPSNENSFYKYMLVHDWVHGDLRDRFIRFLNSSSNITPLDGDLVSFVDQLIPSIQ